MSNAMLTAVRTFQTSPSAKAVLVAMADYSDDSGRCWPSLARLSEFTCLCERAVRNAIKDLEKLGVLTCERASGMTTHYVIRAEIARTTPAPHAGLKQDNPGTSCPPAPDAPRHVVPDSPAPDAAGPRHEMPEPRHQMPPNHQEPPKQPPRTTKRGADAPPVMSVADLVSEGLDEALAVDFLAHRKKKKAELTFRAWSGIRAEAVKAGWTISAALEKTITRNWVAFEAAWVASEAKQSRLITPSANTEYGSL